MDYGTADLPVAPDWETWARGGFAPPVGTVGGPVGPAAVGSGFLQNATDVLGPKMRADDSGSQAAPQTGLSALFGSTGSSLLQKAADLVGPRMRSDDSAAPQAPAAQAPAPQVAAQTPATQAPAQTAAEATAATPDTTDQFDVPPTAPRPSPLPKAQALVSPGEAPGQRNYSELTPTIVGAESGGRADAKNPTSTAGGRGQFLDGTWQQFIQSPANTGGWTMADKNNGTAQLAAIPWYASVNDGIFQKTMGRPATDDELLASHMLGGGGAAALAANPQANAYDVLSKVEPNTVGDVFKNNASVIRPTMSGGDALASIATYFKTHKGSTSVASGPGIQTAQGGNVATDASAGNAAQPSPVLGFQPEPLPYSKEEMQLPKGSSLLALASGLLQGPNLSQGLGAGLKNMLAVQQTDQSNKLKANQLTRELNQLGMTGAYRSALIANSIRRIGDTETPKPFGQPIKGPDGTMLQPMRAASTGAVTYAPMAGVSTQQQRVDNASNLDLQSQLAGVKKTAQVATGDNFKDADAIDARGRSAITQIPMLENFKQVVSNGASPGSDAVSQFKRMLAVRAGLNIDGTNASSVQLASALGKQLQVSGVQGMKGLGLRTQQEFNVFRDQVAAIDQNPDVIRTLVQPMLDGANFDYGVYQKWHDPATDQRKILSTPMGVDNWMAPMVTEQATAHGVNVGQPNRPTVSQGADGWQATPGGARFRVIQPQ